MKSRKIVLLTATLAQGGAELVVAQLALALRAAGFEVSVVTMLPPTAFVGELASGRVSVVSLGMRRGRPNLAGLTRFMTYLYRNRPDLLHSHMYHANMLARIARLIFGVPIVATVHSEIECSHRATSARLREWLYRITNSVCGRTTAVSERVRERYVRNRIIPAQRIEVIDNGLDLKRFTPHLERRSRTRTLLGWESGFTWLAVGRLETAKDYPTLIRAFHAVHESNHAARLVVAGEGRLRSQLERQIEEAGLRSAVTLAGWRTDVPDLLNACDAFVMSSAWEGAQLALLEASASERPVVATEVGVAPQAIVHGRTGLLVAPRDPEALARAMQQLIQMTPESLRQMGENGRRHVKDRFSLDRVHQRYLNLYEQVLAASS